jgi:very-short-patch-repair endonuclease
MGQDAAKARQHLREAASRGGEICRSYEVCIDAIATEFGVAKLRDFAPGELVGFLDALIERQAELPDFLSLWAQRQELVEAGLGEVLDRADAASLLPSLVPGLFDTLVAEARAEQARKELSVLRREDGAKLEARRRIFADRDRLKIQRDRTATRSSLLENMPLSGTNVGARKIWTEMALLRNEFPKQRKFTPLRGLLSRAGRSIQALKPCFMMSPLSLAKFSPPKDLIFDLVIIDEASQMKPEDALGGMLRTKQIVVVGDSKQLPPTDFFTRSASSNWETDDDSQDIEDESILEGCQKVFREVRSLKWHYRSRCESLIAFSNQEFYRNSLITFPMARPASFSVDLVKVGGFYQARRNVAEAGVVAEQAIGFMRRFAEHDEETIPTLGLVTINVEQRDVLYEELRRLSAGDDLVDRYREKVDKKGEPVFVKNLENVQGDERDFIFISLTYGREPGATAVKQRFGPITGKQGHRRLNVLFTRARNQVCLFSSFGSQDVLPSETSSDGVHILKRYLEYAERGGRAPVDEIGSEPESDFEVEVGGRLRAKGYAVDYQVGVSGYRIDIGIRHPDDPGVFLAGIECDGARYHSIKSARDRDRLREEVLRGLGWEILRVWSTDWFDDPGLETEKLTRKLHQLRSRPLRSHSEFWVGIRDPGTTEDIKEATPSADSLAEDSFTAAEVTDRGEPRALGLAEVDDRLPVAEVGPLTERQAYKALEKFREIVIKEQMADWEPHRSILREGLIETFVRQRLRDPADWFLKVPQFQRSGTNPIEKQHFLSQICEIVDRIVDEDHENVGKRSGQAELVLVQQVPRERQPEQGVTNEITQDNSRAVSPVCGYGAADFAELDLVVRADLFYEQSYAPVLRRMVAHVIVVESPIYEDLLVARIARAHRFQRSGGSIRGLVLSAVEKDCPRTREGGRVVLWQAGARTDLPVPYRHASNEVRAHTDIPIAELASLALPFVRLRMDDEVVLRKLAETFVLDRLREATRARFQEAVALARSSLLARPK